MHLDTNGGDRSASAAAVVLVFREGCVVVMEGSAGSCCAGK